MADSSKDTRALWAVLFYQGTFAGYDIYSALDSSPWTVETAGGGDPRKEKAQRKYMKHAAVRTVAAGVIGSLIAGSVWPIIGASLVTVDMLYLYNAAIKANKSGGGQSWWGS